MGRSEASGVWHYIGRLTDSWDKQVILLLVEHPQGGFFSTIINCTLFENELISKKFPKKSAWPYFCFLFPYFFHITTSPLFHL